MMRANSSDKASKDRCALVCLGPHPEVRSLEGSRIMGKSLDLPDPLESASNKPLANADDLLAQLANEEVDRLLAEAETEGKQKAEALKSGEPIEDAPPAPTPTISPEEAIQGELDALFSEITALQPNPVAEPTPHDEPPMEGSVVTPSADALPHGTPAPAAPAPPNIPTHSPASSNLPDDVHPDEVLAAIVGEAGQLGKLQDFTPPPPPPAALMAAHAALATTDATSAAERAGLAKIDLVDHLPGPGELAALTGPIEDDGPLPVYLKPLEWMSAPLELLPSAARDVLGQVAILTLVNAIAVLIYVFVFRKH